MKCLTESCMSEIIYSRSLCRRCYNRLHKRIIRAKGKWGDFISAGQCIRAKRYEGLTPAVRRDNLIKSKETKNTYALSQQQNLDRLLELGKITQEQYNEFIKKVELSE